MTDITFDISVQELFIQFMLSNSELYVRVQNIFNPKNFDKSLFKSAQFIQDHVAKFGTMPDLAQVTAIGQHSFELISEIREGHIEWFLTEFEKFTKKQELERAILQSAELLEKGDFSPVESLIKAAVQIGLTRNMGTDYFSNPKERLLKLKNSNGQVSTGWRNLDDKLYGGFSRGELNVFAGISGAGKSLFLQNLACNWILDGYSGIYVTLELSEGLVSMRMDSMLTGVASRNIFADLDNIDLKVRMIAKKSGKFKVIQLPAQSSTNAVRAYIKELEVQTNIKYDFLLIDYLDLLTPSGVKIDPTNLFVKDKFVSEELRNLYVELNMFGATASQLNRGSEDEIEYGHQNISGGISKINSSDNVLGIFTSRAMREHGKYQLQLMKTRNSTGLGSKVDLNFDINSMRITGLTEEEEAQSGLLPANNIMSRIRSKSSPNAADSASGKSTVSTTKIQDLLNDLKNKAD